MIQAVTSGPKDAITPSKRYTAAPVPATAAQPKFGSATATATNIKLAASAKTLVATENIIETFLWSFLGLDVLGMWVPRVKVSLTRGAIPYDVRQDPEMKDKPLNQQVRHSLAQNVKGLNWINFYEEAGREFATGPGMLMAPTVIYMLAKRYAYGGNAIRMKSETLSQHGELFSARLNELPSKHPLHQTQVASEAAYLKHYREQVKAHFMHALYDKEFFQTDFSKSIQDYRSKLKPETIADLPAVNGKGKVTGEQYLNAWLNQWGEHFIQNGNLDRKALVDLEKKLGPARSEFEHLFVNEFNEDLNIAKAMKEIRGGKNVSPNLMSSNKINVLGSRRSVQALSTDMYNLSHYFSTVAKERLTGKEAVPIQETAYRVMKQASTHKGIFQTAAAVISGIYIFSLVQITQKHAHYPGERLAQLEDQKKTKKTEDNAAPIPPSEGNIPAPTQQPQRNQFELVSFGGRR